MKILFNSLFYRRCIVSMTVSCYSSIRTRLLTNPHLKSVFGKLILTLLLMVSLYVMFRALPILSSQNSRIYQPNMKGC